MGRVYIPPNNHFAQVHKLSKRELDIIRLLSQGLCYKEIARTLYISHGTVQNYGKSILSKTQASNMIHAAVMFAVDEIQQESLKEEEENKNATIT